MFGVAFIALAHLFNLIQQNHWVIGFGLDKSPDDYSWHRSHIGPTVPSQLSLVVQASKRNPCELLSQRLGDGFGNRSLSNSGWAMQANHISL